MLLAGQKYAVDVDVDVDVDQEELEDVFEVTVDMWMSALAARDRHSCSYLTRHRGTISYLEIARQRRLQELVTCFPMLGTRIEENLAPSRSTARPFPA